jgi:hypothetical protein
LQLIVFIKKLFVAAAAAVERLVGFDTLQRLELGGKCEIIN